MILYNFKLATMSGSIYDNVRFSTAQLFGLKAFLLSSMRGQTRIKKKKNQQKNTLDHANGTFREHFT